MIEKISNLFDQFKVDAEKSLKGNKAAGIRARKASLAIEKAMKEFRKESLKANAEA